MEESTQKAIDYKIAQELSELGTAIHRYIVKEQSLANSQALALHRGYQYLQTDLVPATEARITTYCLDVGVRDSGYIASKLQTAFATHLTSLARSLANSYQTQATMGSARQEAIRFEGWVSVYGAAFGARVHVELEKRRHADPPATRASSLREAPHTLQGKAAFGSTYHITGPTQINSNSPAGIQNNSGLQTVHTPPVKKKGVRRYFARLVGVATILGVGATILGVGIDVYSRFHKKPQASIPPQAAMGPTAPMAPAPSTLPTRVTPAALTKPPGPPADSSAVPVSTPRKHRTIKKRKLNE